MGTENIYGAPMGTTPVATSNAGRPVAGPADPEAVRRLLAEQERAAKIEAIARLAQRTPAQPVPSPTRDLSALTAARRLQGRQQQIEGAVDGR